MDGHVPNDGRTDGCWCEKMFYWPGGWPWWWKFPWVYWGPFMPADLPPKELPPKELPPKELPPKELPPKDLPPKDLPPKDLLPEEPLPEEPLPKEPDVAGEVVCQSVMRRRRCNKAPGCEWEGPRKAKQGGRCVASGASDVVAETPAAPLPPGPPVPVRPPQPHVRAEVARSSAPPPCAAVAQECCFHLDLKYNIGNDTWGGAPAPTVLASKK